MNRFATEVFNIPELLELILLALPGDNIHQELSSIRTIALSQTASRTWHTLIKASTPIRKRLYLSTPIDLVDSREWNTQHAFPPAQPNPWIPDLLLNQRSWGSAYPFDVHGSFDFEPSQPRHWTFSFEVSNAQYQRFPGPGPWRAMLAASPPFTHFWSTRSFYELGSGRAPFVHHLDYDPRQPKSRQLCSRHCPEGVTLGDLVDAVGELFAKYPMSKFVMIESVRVLEGDDVDLSQDRPTTRSYMPGMSAEKAHGWHRGQ